MGRRDVGGLLFLVCFSACSAVPLPAQSISGSLSCTVTDPTGAVVPGAELTLTSEDETALVKHYTSDRDGLYTFPNVSSGIYDLRATKTGFRDYIQTGIAIRAGSILRQDVVLHIGAAEQKVEVRANASPLNFENGERKEGVNPETIKELPLLVAGSIRSSAAFVSLLPGVTQ